jgi:hypothetical protein
MVSAHGMLLERINVLKKIILANVFFVVVLSANYSAEQSGIAMSNLSSMVQSSDAYSSVPAVAYASETALVTNGPVLVLAKPLVSGNISNWTNQPVQITLLNNNTTSNSILQYRLNALVSWNNYVAAFVVTGNTVVFARVVNVTLNISEEIAVTVNNIDTDLPQVVATANALDFEMTRYQINISASDQTSGIKEIINPDGLRASAMNTTYIVTQNGIYTFSVSDLAGNQVQYAMTVTINQAVDLLAGTTTITKIARPLAYPTIFDPAKENTKFYFELHDAGSVMVRIYTIGGDLVKTIDLDAKAGINYVVWDGQSVFRSAPLDSGVYLFYVVGKSKVYGRGKVILMRGR